RLQRLPGGLAAPVRRPDLAGEGLRPPHRPLRGQPAAARGRPALRAGGAGPPGCRRRTGGGRRCYRRGDVCRRPAAADALPDPGCHRGGPRPERPPALRSLRLPLVLRVMPSTEAPPITAVAWRGDHIEIIDQTVLPGRVEVRS